MQGASGTSGTRRKVRSAQAPPDCAVVGLRVGAEAMKKLVLRLFRIRTALLLAGVALLVALSVFGSLFQGELPNPVKVTLAWLPWIAVVLAFTLMIFGPRALPDHETTAVRSPVHGRWLGMNSPASKVPSHGLHAYGQAYAIDLVHEPTDATRPTFGDGPAMRASRDYPAFGQPVVAMIDGVVVKASGWRRDHRARSSKLALVYLLVEGALRELGGPGFLIGNHVTIRGADGIFATVAHLQHGSVRVRVGDSVHVGERIAQCGNSGNSSEPHVHAQLMDGPSPWTAQGLPMTFQGITLDDDSEPVDGLPKNAQHMCA